MASGMRKKVAASTHNRIEPGPACAAEAIQRVPIMHAIANNVRSRSPSSRWSGKLAYQFCNAVRIVRDHHWLVAEIRMNLAIARTLQLPGVIAENIVTVLEHVPREY